MLYVDIIFNSCIFLENCKSQATCENALILETAANTAVYSCNPGLSLVGDAEVTCDNGQWSDAHPVCIGET